MGDISILDRVPSIADFVLVRVDKELSVVHRKTLQVVSIWVGPNTRDNSDRSEVVGRVDCRG